MAFSDFDKANIGSIVAGHGNWFTAELIRLIVKADVENRYKLSVVYPEEVAAVEKWGRKNS
jgi:hypothetical protein